MSQRDYWFYYKNYTECFCYIKKCATLKFDTKLDPAEIYVLEFIDNLMRDYSYRGTVISGFLTSTLVAGFVSMGLNKNPDMRFVALRSAISIGVLWNIGKIMDAGSHLIILLGMPTIFEILDQGVPQNGTIKTNTFKFFEELKEEKNIV
jgi:hypothetical protein